MTTEELLRPRYKVIATWPGMEAEPFGLHQIVTLTRNVCEDGVEFIHIPIKHIPLSYMRQAFFEKYPHLFKKLEWWEDRNQEDMPEYVKSIKQEYSYGVTVGKVIKVKEWVKICDTIYVIQSKNREYHPSCFIPATRTEYEQYIKKQTNATTENNAG